MYIIDLTQHLDGCSITDKPAQRPDILIHSFCYLFQFRSTDSQRTKASANAFAEGLFGRSSGVYFPTALKNDTLIQV
jgi:hypothetical protein